MSVDSAGYGDDFDDGEDGLGFDTSDFEGDVESKSQDTSIAFPPQATKAPVTAAISVESTSVKTTSVVEDDRGYGDDFEVNSPVNKDSSVENAAVTEHGRPFSAPPAPALEQKETQGHLSPVQLAKAKRGMTASGTRNSFEDTSSKPLTRRERLEKALVELHKKPQKATVKRYTTVTKDNKVSEHIIVVPEGRKFKPTHAYGFSLTDFQKVEEAKGESALGSTSTSKNSKEREASATKWTVSEVVVKDYRSFRPTSPDRRMHPTQERGEPFLLPGQKPAEQEVAVNAKVFTDALAKLHKDITHKIDANDSKWHHRLQTLLDGKVKQLGKVHREEMNALVEDFDKYADNRLFADTAKGAEERKNTRYNAHIRATLEQEDYVEKHLHAQRQHNSTRCAVLTSLVRNRQVDERAVLKDSMRTPLELLKRVTDSQVDVLGTASSKVKRALLHIERLADKTKASIDPKVRLRTQRSEQHQLVVVRTAIQTLNDLCENIDHLYDRAFLDYDPDAFAREAENDFENSPRRLQRSVSAIGRAMISPNSPGKGSKSNSRPNSPGAQDSNANWAAEIDVGTRPSDKKIGSLKPHKFRAHNETMRESHYRNINGYKYRTRSPPRGAVKKEITMPEEKRPSSSSYLRGHVPRGQNDILNRKNNIPYSVRQLCKGREGKEAAVLPALQTTMRLLSWEQQRPSTAPAGMGGTAPLGDAHEFVDAKSIKKVVHLPAAATEQRPQTAAAASQVQQKHHKKSSGRGRPKSSTDAANVGESPLFRVTDEAGQAHQGWDGTAYVEEEDDDASVGIMQDDELDELALENMDADDREIRSVKVLGSSHATPGQHRSRKQSIFVDSEDGTIGSSERSLDAVLAEVVNQEDVETKKLQKRMFFQSKTSSEVRVCESLYV